MKHNSKHKLRGPRVSTQKICNDPGFASYEALAAGIVAQAVADSKRLLQEKQAYKTDGMNITQQELVLFFESSWCDILLGTTDLNGHRVREMVGI